MAPALTAVMVPQPCRNAQRCHALVLDLGIVAGLSHVRWGPARSLSRPHAEERARIKSAFTRVFDALCVRASRSMGAAPHPEG
jgi:hypothetical protein